MSVSPKKQMLGGDGVMRVITPSTPVAEADGYFFDYLIVNEPNTRLTFLEDVNAANLQSISEFNFGNSTLRVLQPGIIVTGKNGGRITDVTVLFGSVIGYQSRDKGNLRL